VKHTAATTADSGKELVGTVIVPCHDPFADTAIFVESGRVVDVTLT
jgi:hypothetical protein